MTLLQVPCTRSKFPSRVVAVMFITAGGVGVAG
jgi:hypothetical protein